MNEEHHIGWALQQAQAGIAVTRKGWLVPGQRLSYVPGNGKAEAYVCLTTASGRTWPWTAGQRDLLADDYVAAGEASA